MKVWIAVVCHRHGVNTYAAKTRAKLMEQLYKFVEEWWDDEMPKDRCPIGNRSPEEAVREYFENADETLDCCEEVEVK